MGWLHTQALALYRGLFPAVCVLCEGLLPTGAGPIGGRLCEPCRQALGGDPHFTCPRCTSSVGEHAELSDGCPRCAPLDLRFQAALRLNLYDGQLRDAVLRIKHRRGELLALTLGRFLGEARGHLLRAWQVGCVIPVPLHWWRRWQRGYNQSAALAVGLSEALAVPVVPGALRRVRDTRRQTQLTPAQRVENVRGAFAVGRPEAVRGLRVLLVDDVLTTGSTLSQCAAALRDAGATWVGAVVLGHR